MDLLIYTVFTEVKTINVKLTVSII